MKKKKQIAVENEKKSKIETKVDIPKERTDNEVEEVPKNEKLDKEILVVGVGASAGGLAAFEAFFSGMPADSYPGMAFVLVQHLAPDHKSILTDLIRRYTRMEVFEVEDGMPVQINCAYIIPPNRNMALLNGMLHLLEPVSPRGQRMPIDYFFRSLAHDQHERAIGVVLSGTGSDGTSGMRAIKGEGGMVMVQDLNSAEFDGMPRSAISTGLVDYELPPVEMASQIIDYTSHAFGKSSRSLTKPPGTEGSIKKIFILLRNQTGNDFSQYKISSIHRRIERRMAVHQIESLGDYVNFLQQTPDEVSALFRDLLIGVTNFFRDPDAFAVIEEKIIPKLFVGKDNNTIIRVWVPGCSTGEEAYSLAILLAEHQRELKTRFKVQIFATDIDSHAIDTARTGIYPASIAADMSPQRLKRFFSSDLGDNSYHIHKSIRDMLIFSEHNMIKHPPFSKLDMISCRNLLIYMSSDLQKKIIPLFHYALNPGGVLFLGISETVGGFVGLFSTLDRKQKIYLRMDALSSNSRAGLSEFMPPMTSSYRVHHRTNEKVVNHRNLSLREITEQTLLQQLVQVGALVNAQGYILYLHGRTGMFLEPTPGEIEPSNILKMAREGLKSELIKALHKVTQTGENVMISGLRVKTNGNFDHVNLIVCSAPVGTNSMGSNRTFNASEQPLYLVILEQARMSQIQDPLSVPNEQDSEDDVSNSIKSLKQELRRKEEYLNAANEELLTSNEELKSSNEELQSVNEELQSVNEELETSKEELQSINEELATVNAELQTKVADLSQANNDLNNLLAGTGIATIFVDTQLRLMRFTPAATKIINLIQNDIGRPVAHIVSNLHYYNSMIEDIQSVLDTLIPKEAEVQIAGGLHYVMRILPYRTTENVIEGAVLTFMDITETRRIQMELRDSQARFRFLMQKTHLIMSGFDTDLRYTWIQNTYPDFEESTIIGKRDDEIADNAGTHQLIELKRRVIETGKPHEEEISFPLTENLITYLVSVQPVFDDDEKIIGANCISVNITARKKAENAYRESKQKYRTLLELSLDAKIIGEIVEDGNKLSIVDCNQAALDLLGFNRDRLLTTDLVNFLSQRQPDGRFSSEKAKRMIGLCLSKGNLRFEWLYYRLDGESLPIEITMTVFHEKGKTFLHSVWRDLTKLNIKVPPPEPVAKTNQEGERT